MIFTQTNLTGAFLIELEEAQDDRGFFARSWCKREFEARGLNPQLVQCNISLNWHKATLRGIHYQVSPFKEAKLVRCTAGSIFDVVIDLRPDSPSFGNYAAEVLSARNHKMLFVPEGCAHGFLTLEDNTEVFYQMSEFYSSEHARGIRWNDPAFGINWPLTPTIMSEQDRSYSDFVTTSKASSQK